MSRNTSRNLTTIVCIGTAFAAALMTFGAVRTYASAGPTPTTQGVLERGRFLVAYGACNDCHTPGWAESDGTLPTSRWLTGSDIGLRGPWGTSYPANVRLIFQGIDEDQWLHSVRTRGGHPPMHWHDLRYLSESDQRAIYRFVRSLGPAGKQVPAALPPWREPTTPYIDLVPRQPKR